MNIVLNHYEKGNLSIPSVILKLAGLYDENLMQGHIERDNKINNGALAVCKKKMTALELIKAIEFFKELASDFTVKLALACGECDDCGYCHEDEESTPQECKNCKNPCHGVEIPVCVLEDAGIDAKAGLEFDARDGEVIIRPINDESDIPAELIEILAKSNICTHRLRDLIESGEVVYG